MTHNYQYDLSIIVCHRDGDEIMLERCLKSIPSWAQIIIVATKAHNVLHLTIPGAVQIRDKAERITKAVYYHPPVFDILSKDNAEEAKPFDFAAMRNEAQKLAAGRWIMFLDDDEHLDIIQHGILRDTLREWSDKEIFAMRTRNVGVIPSLVENGKAKAHLTEQLRLYRNDSGIRWDVAGHENIQISLQKGNKDKIVDTSIFIIHEGYICSDEELHRKLHRNIASMLYDKDYVWRMPHYWQLIKNTFKEIETIERRF